jgi:hypothetical protein
LLVRDWVCLNQIVAAVSAVGITAANLVQITSALPNVIIPEGGTSVPPPSGVPATLLGWTFQLAVPFSKTKDTTAALTSLQNSISQNNSGLTLSFSLSGTRVSGQESSNCNLADLAAQARAQAQQTATSEGLNAGAIVGLTSATSTPPRSGCSLTARYALGTMFAQQGLNSITITATPTNNIQPDQVLVGLSVQSPTTSGLDDITGALTGAGVSGANFTGVYTWFNYTSGNLPPSPELAWSFTLTAPLAKISATLTQILSAQQSISANKSGLTLTF